MYASPNTVRVIKSRGERGDSVAGHVAAMREIRKVYRIFIGRHRHRCKDNTRMNLREIGLEGVDWIHLA
jgi:hypothetical protein